MLRGTGRGVRPSELSAGRRWVVATREWTSIRGRGALFASAVVDVALATPCERATAAKIARRGGARFVDVDRVPRRHCGGPNSARRAQSNGRAHGERSGNATHPDAALTYP